MEARGSSSRRGFGRLSKELKPALRVLAAHLSRRLMEDLVQEALLGIWKKLDTVDIRRPKSIRRMLVVIGVRKMVDELRRQDRQIPAHVPLRTVPPPEVMDETNGLFSGLLLEYEKYIEANATFNGAHKYLAKEHGIPVQRMRRKYHIAVKEFLEGQNK